MMKGASLFKRRIEVENSNRNVMQEQQSCPMRMAGPIMYDERHVKEEAVFRRP